MAVFHVATNTPPKPELISPWLHEQAWVPAPTDVEFIESFHLDDPGGQVGMQVFIVRAGHTLLQVPVTYRSTRLPGGDDGLIGILEHSVLGTRHVYDGFRDAQFIAAYAGVAASGYGQALGFAEHDGRLYAWPDGVRLHGLGQLSDRIAVDRFDDVPSEPARVVLRNDYCQLTAFRQLSQRELPRVGLTATWIGQTSPILLTQVDGVRDD